MVHATEEQGRDCGGCLCSRERAIFPRERAIFPLDRAMFGVESNLERAIFPLGRGSKDEAILPLERGWLYFGEY